MLEVYNEQGQLIVRPDSSGISVFSKGTFNGYAEIFVESDPAGMLFVRPRTGGFVYGVIDKNQTAQAPGYRGLLGINSAGLCDYAVARPTASGSPLDRGENYGLQLFGEDGGLYFSSSRYLPRIRQSARRVSTGSGGAWPFTMPGFEERPWILANRLWATSAGVGETSESMGCVGARIIGTTVQFQFLDYVTGSVFPSISDRASYDPLRDVPAEFFLASIQGI